MNDLAATLTRLESAQLVRRLLDDEPAYIFKHALVQDTAYQLMLKNRRRDIHRQVVSVYEQLYADRLHEFAALLSDHAWLGELPEKTAAYSIQAGTDALRVYALREALDDFDRALDALNRLQSPPPTQMIDALIGWAEGASRIRPYNEQLEKLARAEKLARELDDKRRLVRALYRTGIAHTAQGHNLRAIPSLTECFKLANELGDERLAVVPTLFMGLATGQANPREGIHLFERAIELALNYDDLNTLAIAWSAKGMTHARLGEFNQAQRALERALGLVDQLKSGAAQSDVYLFAAWAFLDLGNWRKGLEYGELCVNTARVAENLDCMCGGYDCIGFNRLAERNLPKAIEMFREAIQSSQFSGADVFENLGRAGLAMAEYYNGRVDALGDLEQAFAHSKEINDEGNRASIAEALGRIYLSKGDAVRAEFYLNVALEYYRRAQMTAYTARTLEMLAQSFAQQGRTVEAQRIRQEAASLNSLQAVVVTHGN